MENLSYFLHKRKEGTPNDFTSGALSRKEGTGHAQCCRKLKQRMKKINSKALIWAAVLLSLHSLSLSMANSRASNWFQMGV